MKWKSYGTVFVAQLNRYKWFLLTLFCGILLPLRGFAELAEGLRGQGGVLPFDEPTLLYIRHFATPDRDAVMALLTIAGAWLALPFLLGVIWWLRQGRLPARDRQGSPASQRVHNGVPQDRSEHGAGNARDALFFALSIVGSYGLDLLAKAFYHRARPALWVSVTPKTDYSFPSGHSMVSMAVAIALVLIAWPTKWRWQAVLLCLPSAVAVAFSRLYLGVHYPSDVLGGWCAALLWVMGLHLVLPKLPAASAQASSTSVSLRQGTEL
jgi:membrane-associated phospholipid phosphatase